LLRFAEVDTVVYEFTAGSLSWPVLATDVNIDPPMGALYFTVQTADGEQRTISGKLSGDRQSLTLAGGYCANAAVPIKLARVTDFGRSLKACTPCPAITGAGL
jgi:flagellar basal body rod protein FlgG